jgi:hypothetical protein
MRPESAARRRMTRASRGNRPFEPLAVAGGDMHGLSAQIDIDPDKSRGLRSQAH